MKYKVGNYIKSSGNPYCIYKIIECFRKYNEYKIIVYRDFLGSSNFTSEFMVNEVSVYIDKECKFLQRIYKLERILHEV